MAALHASCVGSAITTARYEVAQIVRAHALQLEAQHHVGPEQKAVLRAIANCRTAALGGHLQVCERCGYERPRYNSCRNRHCPKCQALSRKRPVPNAPYQVHDPASPPSSYVV
jgi:copper oxidase (laccase) domain-containing protein